jgi:hypothetical protein
MPGEWKPNPTDVDRTAPVREELQNVFASDAFKGGKRAQDFLQLVVEHALAGRFDNLRERMLGVEMFGRPVNYDTANDAVVRVKASEVRRRAKLGQTDVWGRVGEFRQIQSKEQLKAHRCESKQFCCR